MCHSRVRLAYERKKTTLTCWPDASAREGTGPGRQTNREGEESARLGFMAGLACYGGGPTRVSGRGEALFCAGLVLGRPKKEKERARGPSAIGPAERREWAAGEKSGSRAGWAKRKRREIERAVFSIFFFKTKFKYEPNANPNIVSNILFNSK